MGSIRAALPLLIAVILTVVIGLVEVVLSTLVEDEILSHSHDTLGFAASNLASDLARGVNERFQEMSVLADELGTAQLEDRDLLRSRLSSFVRKDVNYSWLAVVDPAGVVVAANQGLLEGMNVAERPWFRPSLQGPYLGDKHPAVLLANLLPKPSGMPLYFLDIGFPL
jgi:hypothetical protein